MRKIIFYVLLLLLFPCNSNAQGQKKPWATLCNGTLTFSYGFRPTTPSQIYCPQCNESMSFNSNYCGNCGEKNTKTFVVYEVPLASQKYDPSLINEKDKEDPAKNIPWANSMKDVITVIFDSSFRQVTNITSTSFWFGCEDEKDSKLRFIKGVGNLNTENVKYMEGMFFNCTMLTSLDLSTFNTNKVRDMACMFSGCKSLTSLKISSFCTNQVISMACMFVDCEKLSSINISNFKTDNVLDMTMMFSGCKNLTILNLVGFNTKQVKLMNGMFAYCEKLNAIYVSRDGWNTQCAKDNKDVSFFIFEWEDGVEDMFQGCPAKIVSR